MEEIETREDRKFYFETIAKIEDSAFLEEVLKSEKWEIIRRIFETTRDDAQQKLNGEALDNPESIKRALRWQIMIDFYDNVLPNMIERYRAIGKAAYETANDRGWLSRIARHIKDQF